jgi:molybdate transport system ATP-binding protein
VSIRAIFESTVGDFSLDVDLTIPSTGVTAVFGPSGCGKTTLLRAIAGLERFPNAVLRIGHEVWQDAHTFVPTHLRSLGFVFQEPSLFSHLTVGANVEYGSRRTPDGERTIAPAQAIDLLGIGGLLERKPAALSGGEKQRVAIARALAASPRLLLMDEPLNALDETRKREILPFLDRLHRDLEIPVLYVSHSTDEVARLADHLVLLDQGRITASGAIAEVMTNLELPLARGDDAEALVETIVSGHDEDFHLTFLDFSGGTITVPRMERPPGFPIRVRIAARDVSLTLEEQSDTSILNIFPTVVDALTPIGPAQMIVRLMAGEVPILSRVTRKSASLLCLGKGSRVFAQAKSVAVLS